MSASNFALNGGKGLVHDNRRIALCEVANVLGISYGSVQSILEDNLNMHWIKTKSVPHLLG
jgi:hypothetical protein